MSNDPVTVICRYRVRPGREDAMRALLAKHWSTLHRVGLVTADPPLFFEGIPARRDDEDSHGESARVFVEIFTWKTDDSALIAHETPEVMAIWEPMGDACETMEFPHFHRFDPRS
jgi:hypothetical protein